jgi:uncharacterized protein YlaN (UPF0358 family)
MSVYDSFACQPLFPMDLSNTEFLRLDYEQLSYNQTQDFNSRGFRENSLIDDFHMIYSIEELNKKYNIIEKPEENTKKNLEDFPLGKQDCDANNKENTEKKKFKDKAIMDNNNSKNQNEFIKEKEKDFVSINGQSNITNIQTNLIEKIPEKKISINYVNKKRKRGPKIKRPSKKVKINDMFSKYNLSRKFRRHFLNYCVSFSNDLVKPLRKKIKNFNKKILKLNKNFKTAVSKKEDDILKQATLGGIINRNISSKFRNFDTAHNHKIYDEKVQKNEILKEIFSIDYKTLFKIYYQGKRNIQLKKCGLNEEILQKYGLNKDIELSTDVKMFNDLLENNTTIKDFLKEDNYLLAKKYKNSLRNNVIKKYMPNAIFLISEEYN